MLPDPRWSLSFDPDRFSSQPCTFVEFCCRDDGEISYLQGRLEADEAVDWLERGVRHSVKAAKPNVDHTEGPITGQPYRRREIIASEGEDSVSHGTCRRKHGPPSADDPSSIYKAVFDQDGFTVLPLSHRNATRLVDGMGIPDRFFVNAIVRRRIAAHDATDKGEWWLIRDWMFSAVTLRPNNSDILSTIIIANDDFHHTKTATITSRLAQSKTYCENALFAIVVIVEGVLEEYREKSDLVLISSEDLHYSIHLPLKTKGPRTRNHSVRNPTAVLADIADEKERLLRLHGDLSVLYNSLQTLQNLQTLHTAYPANGTTLQSGHTDAKDMRTTLSFVTASAADIIRRVQSTEARLEFLFPIMQLALTQQDTEVSINLARTSAETAVATKKDSSSMKIIAVLTTIFLPGTFVATLLSTPEYNARQNGQVWRYWVITVPLTLVVMFLLVVWMFWARYRHKRALGDQIRQVL